ncbi:MAG: hypothetical protein IJK60_01375 [Clostridia bacterium]|nr:hypothetical protein [Clostridia bacterium]
MRNGVRLQAHRGVESEYPENTMPSFKAAVNQGYEMIELDLAVTKDGKIVVLHDSTINRTARNADGSEIEKKTGIATLTYNEALEYDFGIAFSTAFRGTKIPLFEDVLALAEKNGIQIKIDNKIQRFSKKERKALFGMLNKSKAQVIISCLSYADAKEVVSSLPRAEISFDGMTDENELKKINALAGRERFSVWIPVDYEMASWAPAKWFATPEKCRTINKYAKLSIWAVKSPESFERAAEEYKPWAAETTGTIKPE